MWILSIRIVTPVWKSLSTFRHCFQQFRENAIPYPDIGDMASNLDYEVAAKPFISSGGSGDFNGRNVQDLSVGSSAPHRQPSQRARSRPPDLA